MSPTPTTDAPHEGSADDRAWPDVELHDDEHHLIDDIDDFLFGGEYDERRFQPVYPWVTIVLFTACLAVCTSLWLGVGTASPGPSDLTRLGGVSGAALDNGQWWKLFASAFVHVSPLHLGLNMLFIVAIGAPFERVTGHLFTVVLIVVGALGSSLGGALLNPSEVGAGASGIAFAIMGATLVLDPIGRTGLGRIARWMLVANIGLGFVIAGTSSIAHVAGLVAGGLVAAPAYRLIDGTRDRAWLPICAAALAAVGISSVSHPAIAGPLGLGSQFDRPVSERVVATKLEEIAQDRPYQAAVSDIRCSAESADGAEWRCTLTMTPIRASGEPARSESWRATADTEGNISYVPRPEGSGHVAGLLRDWGLEDPEHSVNEAHCEQVEAPSWGCVISGSRGSEPFSEFWSVAVNADGSWQRTAMLPTAAGLERTIERRGLQRDDGSAVPVASAQCRQVTADRREWHCDIRETGGDRKQYEVQARPDGSWRLS